MDGSHKGAVLLVTGLDPLYTTCDIIRNLFFNYGDVVSSGGRRRREEEEEKGGGGVFPHFCPH